MFEATSVTTMSEARTVEQIFRLPFSRIVGTALGIAEPYVIDFAVTEIYEPRDRTTSEIDAVLRPFSDPSRAIAVQVKRIRADRDAFHTEQLGHMKELKKAAIQVGHDLERGFHMAYLMILAQVDSRERSGGYWQGGGLSPELARDIRNAVQELPLDPHAGVLLFEMDQPIDCDVLRGGGFGCSFHKEAMSSLQDREITEAVARLNRLARPGRVTWN